MTSVRYAANPAARTTLVWNALRLAMAVLIIAAVVVQFARSVDVADSYGRDVTTTVVNFFSFFTILSNLSAAAVLAWAAIWWFTRGRATGSPGTRAIAVAMACVTTYMVVTGLVYNALLRTVELPQGSEPVWWSNEVLHLVGPLFLLLDLLVGPPRRSIGWGTIGTVVGFPIVWAAYTLIRGPLTTNPVTGQSWWYPYPFLDPHGSGGYVSVAAYVIGIAVVVSLIAWGVVWVDRRRAQGADAP